MLEAHKALADGFFQLNGKFDALKAIVSELHPESAEKLEALILAEQSASSKQFLEIQQKCAALVLPLKDSVH
ncbi:MAG TPA: hypothetical protein VGF96_16160 [Terracidiphilus sp.]|jgi:hypothetical protein